MERAIPARSVRPKADSRVRAFVRMTSEMRSPLMAFFAISAGSRTLAPISMILRATISVSGSLRSTKLSERSVKVHALFNLAISSGVNLLSLSKRLIGISAPGTPEHAWQAGL